MNNFIKHQFIRAVTFPKGNNEVQCLLQVQSSGLMHATIVDNFNLFTLMGMATLHDFSSSSYVISNFESVIKMIFPIPEAFSVVIYQRLQDIYSKFYPGKCIKVCSQFYCQCK